MPRGDKRAYTDKQKRQAAHIAEGYEARGVPEQAAEARAWATVNRNDGGGNRSGSGRGRPDTDAGSKAGGKAHARGSPEARTAAARKGWDTRRAKAGQ